MEKKEARRRRVRRTGTMGNRPKEDKKELGTKGI